jgi:hypothetical protein
LIKYLFIVSISRQIFPQVVLGFDSEADAENIITALRSLQQLHFDHLLSCRRVYSLAIDQYPIFSACQGWNCCTFPPL